MKRTSRFQLIALLGLVAGAAAINTGCAMPGRSFDSGYRGREGFREAESSGETSRSNERRWAERDEAAGELGMASADELSETQQRALAKRIELRRLERSEIDGRREREQYFRVKPLLRSDSDRIEFLRVGSYEGRERWLRAQGVSVNSPKFARDVQDLISRNDVALGMTKQAVRESWGEPEVVEVAGNPVYGNERWKYVEQIASPEGYQSENRMVYFESGRVVGWEKF